MMTRSSARRVGLVLAAGVMLGPAVAGAAASSTGGSPCPSAASARMTPGCAINSPARHTGKLASAPQRDYYVLHAAKGTKLTLSLTDTDQCLVGHYVSCGTNLKAALVNARGRQIATTPVASPNVGPVQPATTSRTLTAAGTYYVVITGDPGSVTPPPPSTASVSPLPYRLGVTASPQVRWPAGVTVTVPSRGGFHRDAVTQEPGGLIAIVLKDNNPSTGYGWSYAAKPNRAVVARVADRTATPTSGLAGAPATRTITYRAVARGTTRLRLVYLPPSGAGTKPAASLTVAITVT